MRWKGKVLGDRRSGMAFALFPVPLRREDQDWKERKEWVWLVWYHWEQELQPTYGHCGAPEREWITVSRRLAG